MFNRPLAHFAFFLGTATVLLYQIVIVLLYNVVTTQSIHAFPWAVGLWLLATMLTGQSVIATVLSWGKKREEGKPAN